MFFKTTLFAAFPLLAAAQYGYGGGGGSTNPTTSAAPSVPSAPANTAGHVNVDVAPGGNLVFNPANIVAPNGTLVTFFFPSSSIAHSVTQSSFASPCTYLAASGSTPAGFDSGLTSSVQFTVNITDDSKPIWFHCKQTLHCGEGMVGSINAPATGNTADAFLAAAKAIGGSEPSETDNGFQQGGNGAVAVAAPSNTAGSTGGGNNSASHTLVNIGLGAVAAALVAIFLN